MKKCLLSGLAILAGCVGSIDPLPIMTPMARIKESQTTVFSDRLGTWMGPPSYSADANSPSLFKLEYESNIWELNPYYSGYELVHRSIPGCDMVGGGLPEGYSAEHETKLIGGILYGTNLGYEGDQLRYVTYITQVGDLQTGFLARNLDQCIQDGEAVLATLQAVDNPSYSP